ncbi:hypothetical protein D3C81_1646130 [compost metagenome]
MHPSADLRQEIEQHLQQVMRQIGLVRRLTQRQRPVERQQWLIDRSFRLRLAAVVTRQYARQHRFVNRLGQIVIHPGLQQMLALAADCVGGDGDDRRRIMVR